MLTVYLSLIDDDQDKKTFEQMYLDNKDMMYHYAYKILKDVSSAEDAVHDAFLSFARHFKKFEKTDHDRIRSYLMITVRNAAFKIYNRHGKEISTEDVYFDSGQIADISTDIENHELEFRLFQMIKNLDRKYGDVIILKYYCGMRDREIADSLGISRDNVKIRLYRARNILKQKLKEDEF